MASRPQHKPALCTEGIEHRTVRVNGINLHYAEKGEGPAILFLHGFPELWYSWRHQIVALAGRGYRCIAPDLRGYGDTDAPPHSSSYTVFHITGDLIALLDVLGQDQVFLVGHDWGAFMAWYLALFRPERVKALVNLSVSFRLFPNPEKPLESLREVYGDDYYMCRFQEAGEAEAEFAAADTAAIMKNFFAYRGPGPLLMPKGSLQHLTEMEIPLVSWLSEDDNNYFASKLQKTGFTGGFNYYRAINLSFELLTAWKGAKVKVPAKFILGEHDLTYSMPGAKEYIHGEAFKKDVPLLEEVVVIEGAAHWINQERADEVSDLIYNFFRKF